MWSHEPLKDERMVHTGNRFWRDYIKDKRRVQPFQLSNEREEEMRKDYYLLEGREWIVFIVPGTEQAKICWVKEHYCLIYVCIYWCITCISLVGWRRLCLPWSLLAESLTIFLVLIVTQGLPNLEPDTINPNGPTNGSDWQRRRDA